MSDVTIESLEEGFRNGLTKALQKTGRGNYSVDINMWANSLHELLNVKRKDAQIAELQARTQLWNTINKRLEDGSWKNVIEALVKEIKKKEGHVNV